MIALFLTLLNSVNAQAAELPKNLANDKAGDQVFISSCLHAFEKSTAPAPVEISRRICECTAQDSHEQGVKPSSLRKEAERLSANPKYQIKDEGLMNAFRYCTLQLMQEADRE